MAAENDLEKEREKLAGELASLRRAKDDNEGKIADMQRTVEAFQERMKAMQQVQDAWHRERTVAQTGTNAEVAEYVERAAPSDAKNRPNYVVTDKGVVRTKGHFVDHITPKGEIVREWRWGLLDDPSPKSRAQLDLQRALTRRSLLRAHMDPDKRFTPRLDREVAHAARACGGEVEKIFADSSAVGAEWIPDRTLPELEREVLVPTNFTGMFRRRIIPPGGTLKIPYRTGHLRFYKGAVPTTNNPPDATMSDWGTGATSIDPVSAACATQVSREADEDSIIAVLPEIIADIVMAARYAEDDTTLNGDTAATHQDAIATWDGRGMLGGTTGLGTTADHRRRWLGLRARAYDLTSMTTDQNGAQTWDGLRAALVKLGVKNMIRGHMVGNDIVVAPSWEYFFSKMLDWDEFASWEKVSQWASVLSGRLGNPEATPGGMLPGQVGFVEGMLPVCIPFPSSGDLAATGLFTGSGSTTSMQQFDRSRFEYCIRQGFTLESETNIMNDTVSHVTRIRTVFRGQDAVASTVKDVHNSFNLTY